MGAPSSVHLLEIEPDIARFLTDDEREAAHELTVPVRKVPKGPLEVARFLEDARGFGGLLLDGLVLQGLRVGDQLALRLLGPGDFVSPGGTSRSELVMDSVCRAASDTQIAVLGNDVLLAAHRWPRIVAGLHVRMADQTERLATQLAICQLPRVDQRLLALMWLLAESWGHVTPAGTTLPLSLTHDALGGLVGARRPTVTLALGELTERGAIVRQDRGWLLLQAPPQPEGELPRLEEPRLLEEIESAWATGDDVDRIDVESFEAIRSAVARIHDEHARNVDRFHERLDRLARSRERCRAIRSKIAREAQGRKPRGASPRRVPS